MRLSSSSLLRASSRSYSAARSASLFRTNSRCACSRAWAVASRSACANKFEAWLRARGDTSPSVELLLFRLLIPLLLLEGEAGEGCPDAVRERAADGCRSAE
jgi:hypothetical protein